VRVARRDARASTLRRYSGFRPNPYSGHSPQSPSGQSSHRIPPVRMTSASLVPRAPSETPSPPTSRAVLLMICPSRSRSRVTKSSNDTSGAIFKDLQKDVAAASKKMQLFGKDMFDLMEDDRDAKAAYEAVSAAEAANMITPAEAVLKAEADVVARTLKAVNEEGKNLEGGGPLHPANAAGCLDAADCVNAAYGVDAANGFNVEMGGNAVNGASTDKGANAENVAGAAKNASAANSSRATKGGALLRNVADARSLNVLKRVKAWSTRRVKEPAQTDYTSCGPLAFSVFVA